MRVTAERQGILRKSQISLTGYRPDCRRDIVILDYPEQPKFPTVSKDDVLRMFDFGRLSSFVDLHELRVAVESGPLGFRFEINSPDQQKLACIFSLNTYIDNCTPNNPSDWREGEIVSAARITGGYTNPIIRRRGFFNRFYAEQILPMVKNAGFKELNAWVLTSEEGYGLVTRHGFRPWETETGSTVYTLQLRDQ